MTHVRHLREALVAHLERIGVLSDRSIAAAFADVPRHLFVENVSVEEAYEDRALAVKRHGKVVLSSISQPAMIAQMLQLLHLKSGDRVLEIGTGSGYTSALIAHVLGSATPVTTVDIEPDLIAAAALRFSQMNVNAVALESNAGELSNVAGTFDKILVTAKSTDIPEAWWNRLAPGGTLVVPLDLGLGAEAAFAFKRHGDVLESAGAHACVFLPLRGDEPGGESEHIFFRSADARYRTTPGAFSGANIYAVPLTHATPSLLDTADVVVARPYTAFAVHLR